MYADSATSSHPNDTWEASFTVDEDSDSLADPDYIALLNEMDGIDRDAVDLYAILGVARTATDQELRSAYRHLSLLLHPDKHSTINGDDAESAFGRVASAYAILSNPKQRAVYDQFGYKAVKEHGMQLATCAKSDAELRLEYILLKQKAKESRELQLTQPSSEFSLGFDFTDIFDRYLQEHPDDRSTFPLPNVYQLTLAQSVTAGLNFKNSVSLAGQVTAQNGLGVGTGLLLWRHTCGKSFFLGPTTFDTEISYGRGGRGLSTGFRVRRAFGQRYVGTMGLTLGSWSRNSSIIIAPGLSTALNIQLSSRIHARLELRCLRDAGIFSELFWSPESEAFATRISTKLDYSGNFGLFFRIERPVSWSWLNPPLESVHASNEDSPDPSTNWADVDDDDFTTRSKKGVISFSIGVNSMDLLEVSLGAQCNVSAHSRFSGQIRLSLEQGVSLKLSLLRGSQTYSFPFKLSEYPDPIALGYGCLVPFVAFAAIRTLVYEPYLQKQLKRAEKSRRAKFKSELDQKHREALSTQNLMQRAAARIKTMESSISGLIINHAVYGVLNDSTAREVVGPLTVDVTIPLQIMVENSELKLPPGRWSDLQGFYDPSIGLTQKSNQLRVSYTFRNAAHEVTVSDDQGLAIPMVKHKTESFERV